MRLRILRITEVMKIVGLKRTSIYRLIGKGEFPPPIKLTARASGWRYDEIERWIESRQQSAAFAKKKTVKGD